MSKVSLTDIGSITQSPVSAVNVINNNNTAIEDGFDNTISRDGTGPNQMGANLDMNNNRVLNLPQPTTAAEPLRYQDLSSFVGGGTVSNIPVGGTTSQALLKNSIVDYDVKWGDTVSSVGLSLPSDLTVTGSPVTTTGTLTANWANTPTGTGSVVRANSPTLVTPALGTPSSATLTNATGLPVSTGISGLGTNVATFLATPSSANLAAAMTDETGTGANVFATSPTLVTPVLGTPTSGTLTNCTGLPISTGVSGLAAGVSTFLATPSSANLKAAITDETGSGAAVFATSPTLVTPVLGTPTSGTLTNCTGLPLSTGITGNLPVTNLNSGTSASSSTFWRGDGAWATPSGGGSVTSVTGDGLTITNAGTLPPRFGYANATLAASASSGALTIALKDNTGTDPSTTSPSTFWFRNATGTTGSWSSVSATAAMSLVISSGSTMGVTSSTAFRIWVVMFNDAGTLRLGAINCSTSLQIFPLVENVLTSSTAEGGAGAADSAGIFYTGTAVSSKAFVILGYIEWGSLGLTAGTWTTTNLIEIQSFSPGIKKPGEIVQGPFIGTSTTPATTASTSYINSGLSTSITPTSAANLIYATAGGSMRQTSANIGSLARMYRTSNSNLFGTENIIFSSGTNTTSFCRLEGYDSPNTTSSTSYFVGIKDSGGGSTIWVSNNTVSQIFLYEVMA